MVQQHRYEEAKAFHRRYKNNNPKNRFEGLKFKFKSWWRNDN